MHTLLLTRIHLASNCNITMTNVDGELGTSLIGKLSCSYNIHHHHTYNSQGQKHATFCPKAGWRIVRPPPHSLLS